MGLAPEATRSRGRAGATCVRARACDPLGDGQRLRGGRAAEAHTESPAAPVLRLRSSGAPGRLHAARWTKLAEASRTGGPRVSAVVPPARARRVAALASSRRELSLSAKCHQLEHRKENLPLSVSRQLYFDTHALVCLLEANGFTIQQAEIIVSALVKITETNMNIIYKDMVSKMQQEIALQQVLSKIANVKKDMVILEKSEFSALRAENEKIKLELHQLKQQVMDEVTKVRTDTKLNFNLEKSRVKELPVVTIGGSRGRDLEAGADAEAMEGCCLLACSPWLAQLAFLENPTINTVNWAFHINHENAPQASLYSLNEKKMLELRTEIVSLHAQQDRALTQTDRKIETEVAGLKTMLEAHKLDTIKYLAGSVFTCLTVALGFYRLWI